MSTRNARRYVSKVLSCVEDAPEDVSIVVLARVRGGEVQQKAEVCCFHCARHMMEVAFTRLKAAEEDAIATGRLLEPDDSTQH